MNVHVLQSESFDQAAHALARAMGSFGAGDFEQSVEKFRRSVDKLATILGMQAENDQRKAIGASMAYTEDDFAGV